jgi:hypothetical protein
MPTGRWEVGTDAEEEEVGFESRSLEKCFKLQFTRMSHAAAAVPVIPGSSFSKS